MQRPVLGRAATPPTTATCVVVCALLFLLALVHFVTKPGRAWAAIRESEPAALAAGVNITLYKMWAFALASFMTGVAGCLLAAQVGNPTVYGFPTQDSLTLIATALIGGIFTLWGAVVAGVFMQLVPFILQTQWDVDPNWLLIIFGVGPAPGAPHGARRDRPAAPEGPREPRPAHRAPVPQGRGAARDQRDRGRGPHRPLRGRHADRRHDASPSRVARAA